MFSVSPSSERGRTSFFILTPCIASQMQVNAYNSVHVVDSLYRSKYFLTSIDDRVAHHLKSQRKTKDGEPSPFDLDNQRENLAASEDMINTNDIEGHRVTILNCPIGVTDPPEVASTKVTRVENLECCSTHSNRICRPLLPWMNGDGTINELIYNRLLRRVLGIVVLNPGILEVCYLFHSILYLTSFTVCFYGMICIISPVALLVHSCYQYQPAS